jgi:hypothetical protein
MKFNELAWAAFCFYYRSGGDRRYSAIMCDTEFLKKFRKEPETLGLREIQEKVILGYINIQNYDLLVGHRLTETLLMKIIGLNKEIAFLQNRSLADCDLQDKELDHAVNQVYAELQIDGLWVTGASKIAHLLSDSLLPPISVNISRHFDINWKIGVIPWLKRIQHEIREAEEDAASLHIGEAPHVYLSRKLGYLSPGKGFCKSMVKFADEYYWLRFGDNLPVPPAWNPAEIGEESAPGRPNRKDRPSIPTPKKEGSRTG